jgi:acetylglutamate kinase
MATTFSRTAVSDVISKHHLITQVCSEAFKIPKSLECLDVLMTVYNVYIVDGREPHVLLRELFTHQGMSITLVR